MFTNITTLGPRQYCRNYCCISPYKNKHRTKQLLAIISFHFTTFTCQGASSPLVPLITINFGDAHLTAQVTRALVVGRQAGDKILPKFFPPLGSSLNRPALVLRALLWLAPCPEAEIMCYDWARSYPRCLAPLTQHSCLLLNFVRLLYDVVKTGRQPSASFVA